MENQDIKSLDPITSQIQTQTPSAKSNTWIKVMICGMILAVGIAIGIFFYQNMRLQQQIVSIQTQSTPTPLSTPTYTTTPTLDPTANWKIYGDIDLSFMYPSDWVEGPIQTFGSRSVVELKYQDVSLLEFTVMGNYSQISGKPYATLDEYIGSRINKAKDITVNGIPAKIITDLGDPGHVIPSQEVVLFSPDKSNIISLYYKDSYYDSQNRTLNQILSTFKFVRKDETANWETYSDPNGVYQIKFPNTWEIADTKLLDYYDYPTIFIRPKIPTMGGWHSGQKLEIVVGSPIWYSTSGSLCANETCEDLTSLFIQANNQSFKANLVKGSVTEKVGDPLVFDFFRFQFASSPSDHDKFPRITATYFNEDQLSVIKSILSTFKFTN